MDLVPVPAVERGHHGLHAGLKRRQIALGVQIKQRLFVDAHVALVDALVGATVANEVLGRCHRAPGRKQRVVVRVALQAGDHAPGVGFDQRRIFGIALIRAAPAIIAHHSKRRCKNPVDPRGAHFARRGGTDFLQSGPGCWSRRDRCCAERALHP